MPETRHREFEKIYREASETVASGCVDEWTTFQGEVPKLNTKKITELTREAEVTQIHK